MEVKAKAEVTLASIKDVASVTRYYLLQSSSSAIPAKPTTNPPGGNWVRTEPSYTTGSTNSLYFTDLTVFSDGTFTYSDVSLSSSYEAAKVAYNKAVAAQDHIDTLEIGGRNLARGTGDTTGIHWVMSRATEANGVLTITPTTSAGYGKYIMDYLLYGENANQTFTLSFDAREIESASGYGTGAINVYMGVQSPSRIDSIMQSAYDRYGGKTLDVAGAGWNRYSVSFTFPSDITTGQASAFTDDAIISFEFGRARNTCPLEVKNCKLERGAKATDWTPAPEDVSKYTDASVNAIEIGGNNLYAVCNQVYGYLSTSGTISSPTAAKCKTSDYIPVSEGEHYVFQAWVPSIGASQQLWIGYVFYSDTSGTRVGGRTAKYATAGEKYLTYTDITVPANAMYIRVSYRQYEDGYCKLEKGNKPTDWSPAPEDVDSRITGTNLSPFFSYTPYVVGDYWTTWPTGNGYVFTPKGDGWVRIQKDNSTGSSLVRHDIYMTRAEMVQPGSDYTMLFEFRNNNSTGDSADSNVYIVQGTNTQFWGNSIKKILEGVNSNTASTSLISDFQPGTSGVYRKRFVKTSEPSDSSHWTGSEAVYLTCLTFRCAANSTIDYEVRISLYEGECIGPYKPYNVDIADFASVKTAANGKNKVFHQASTVIPASGELKTGDTWFVTDLGYKMRTWNGSQWVDEQFDSDAIVAGAIKTSHLDAGAVTAAKIDVDDLFAQDITATGTITGATLVGSVLSGETINIDTNLVDNEENKYSNRINSDTFVSDITNHGETRLSIANAFKSADMSILKSNLIELYSANDHANINILCRNNNISTDYSCISLGSYNGNNDICLEATCGGTVRVICSLEENITYTAFSGNIVSNSTVVVVKKLGWCQVFGALRPTSSASNFVTILDSTKVPAPQHGIDIYEQAQYWGSGYTTPLRIRINHDGGLDICNGYVGGSYGFSITYPIL